MKMSSKNNFKYLVLDRIQHLPGNAVLRADLADLGSPRQVSRALKVLTLEKKLTKLGYGVYGKLATSTYRKRPYLRGGFLPVVREALDKLGIAWEASKDERDYNNHQITQVPVNPKTKLKQRFRRKLSYQSMEFKGD